MKITNTLAKLMLLSVSMVFSQQGVAQTAIPCTVPECQPLGYIGPMELSTTNLTYGARGYRGWFENGGWQGDLIEYTITDAGGLSTTIDLSGPSPVQPDGSVNWSAHAEFWDTRNSSSHWNTGRQIIFSNSYGFSQEAFRWNELDDYQKGVLDNLTSVTATAGTASAVLNYLRGDRLNEGAAGSMRTRYTVLGDIIHSNPEHVGAPEDSFTDSEYVTFKNDNANREARVYVGANDGMLHAFNAENGQEEWAYVPSMLIHKISRLAGRPYAHTYFVDGGITVKDAYVDGAWRTVLVGSLGAGGKGLYALNVTYPSLGDEALAGGTNKKIMWEERGENTPGDLANGANPDIGYIFDATTITQLEDGKWYAIFGNGIGSTNGQAILMMKELSTSWVATTPREIATDGSTNNGLSAPALVDTNNDGIADIAWAGDIKGDLWRFNLSGDDAGSSYKVYDGDPSQPITAAPDITNHPQIGHVVMFGTGKLYDKPDLETTSTQAIYGVWDTGDTASYATPPTPASLISQSLSFNTNYTRFGNDEMVRTYTTNVAVNYPTDKGWKVDLYPGERMLTTPQLRAGRLKTTIYNPIDGTNWLLEATFLDGNMASNSIYNLNGDQNLDELDRVNGNGNIDGAGDPDYSDPEDIPMAWQRPDGNMSQPTIASLPSGFDTMFLNFLNPATVESAVGSPVGCTGDCVDGLEGGHIDLDTDTSLDSNTDDHTHEYDDIVQRTYIDYLNIGEGVSRTIGGKVKTVKQSNITPGGVDGDQKFIPLIANADFSKGGTLKITANGKTVEYNVVEYQKMIHQALARWDGTGDLKDPDDKKLIFKMSEVDEFRITFNSLAIISGGLHPSVTGCVQQPEFHASKNGRWRNGALTMHLVDPELFADIPWEKDADGNDIKDADGNKVLAESPLDRLVVQTPLDFQEAVYLTNGVGVALTQDLDGSGAIDGTGPAYEIYGGLHADPLRNQNQGDGEGNWSGFLYESTMFWHFDGACYGEPGWAEDAYIASQYSSLGIFYEALDRSGASTLEELQALIDGLIASGCATEGGGNSGAKPGKAGSGGGGGSTDPDSCQAEHDELVDLYALGLLIEANGTAVNCGAVGCLGDGGTGEGGDGSSTSLSGVPFAIVGGIDKGGITSGPNFETGRRTWIDILPE